MAVNISGNNYWTPSYNDPAFAATVQKSQEEISELDRKYTSKAETLEDIRDTAGKSYRVSDLVKLMEKYDPETYEKFCKYEKSADGIYTKKGLHELSKWMMKIWKGFREGTVTADGIKGTAAKDTKAADNTRKTADDELSYLSKKYDGITFIAANYKKGMRYGSTATTNIAIAPAFLKKMANDPELEKEYESYFEDMQRLDKENIAAHEARGRRIVAQGWAIDKDGGISKWGISEPSNKRRYGQEMTERADKIRKEKAEKKKEQEKLNEKRREVKAAKIEILENMKANKLEMDEAGKNAFGDKYKNSAVISEDELKTTKVNNTESVALDIKA